MWDDSYNQFDYNVGVKGILDAVAGFRINETAGTGKYLRGNGSVFTSSDLLASDIVGLSTSLVPEGSNLYWTQGRFDTAFGNKSTTNLAEGTNLYWTSSRFNTAFAAKTTSDLLEGSNLYFTNARVDSRITSTWRGQANGLASLGADGKIPTAQLPALAITDTFVVASQAAMLALSAETGDVAVRTDLNKSFILKGSSPSTLSDWQELLTPTDTITSVNGFTGSVVLTTSHISEGTNQYFTNARARSALSGTTDRISYNSTTGAIDISSAYAGQNTITTVGTLSAGSIPWSLITSTPTTRAGYGITDAAASVHGHSAADITSGLLSLARGGLGSNMSGYSRYSLVYIDQSGGSAAVSPSASSVLGSNSSNVPFWISATAGKVLIGGTTPSFGYPPLDAAQVNGAGSGDQTYTLTTSYAQVSFDTTQAVASLPSAGKYIVRALIQLRCSGSNGGTQFKLRNSTDNTDLSGSERFYTLDNSHVNAYHLVTLEAVVTVNGAKTIQIWGYSDSVTFMPKIYAPNTSITYIKISD